MATATDKTAFIEKMAPFVAKYAPDYEIKCNSAVIAQAILESGWGESKLAAKYHNYFGLKCGTLWKGKSVNMKTQEEYMPGTKTTISDNFRVYDSMEDGVKGYFEFIQLTRYQNLRGITDPQHYLSVIRADGYATSSTYVNDVMAVVRQYGLTKFDGQQTVKKEDSKPVKAAKPTKPVEKPKSGPSKDPKWVGKVTAASLNVRIWAGVDYSNIQSYPVLSYGNLVDVCDSVQDNEGNDWYYVLIGGKFYGFVSAKYVQRA